METILVPTDYSENAWIATEYAAAVAKQTRARLVLLHAFEPMPSSPDLPTPSLEKMLHYRIRRIEEISARLVHKYGISVSYVVRSSEITEVLPVFFTEQKADLIIMGLRGNNPLGRLLMGHVTANVLKEGILPVLVIPKDFIFRPIRHIFFPSDFEQLGSYTNLQIVVDLAKTFGASVELMQLPQSVMVTTRESESSHDSSDEWEKQFADVHVIYSTMYEENLRMGIDLGACESHADLLVLMPCRYGFFEEVCQKDNTQKMVFHSRVPLLALPETLLKNE